MKKVSIIIPCYNDGKYIEEAVNSALNQTYSNTEIIIVDDGSNNATKEVLKTLKNSKTTIITQENKGLSAARNVGIFNAVGTYFLTLDADDKFEPSFIEKAVKILNEKDNVGIVSCGIKCFTDKGVFYKYFPEGGNVENFMFKNNACGNSLYRKKCWEEVSGYDENMKTGYEDWEFHLSITKNGWSVYVIQEYLFNYRNKPNSMLKEADNFYNSINYQYIFLKHKELYQEQFKETIYFLTNKLTTEKRRTRKIRETIDFNLGSSILKPIRFLKKHILPK